MFNLYANSSFYEPLSLNEAHFETHITVKVFNLIFLKIKRTFHPQEADYNLFFIAVA